MPLRRGDVEHRRIHSEEAPIAAGERLLVAALVVAVAGSLAWGTVAGARPAGQRVRPAGAPVDSAWYRGLPVDPAAATAAYQRRVPAAARARGEAIAESRFVILPLRIALLVGSIGLILFGGAAARMRDLARRVSSRPAAQDVVFALPFFATMFLLSLPLQTWAGYVRFRRAGFSAAPFAQWLRDAAVAWGVDTVFYVAGFAAVMALIRRRPRSWPVWAAAVYLLLALVYALISPQYIEPLFNRMTPLAEGPAKRAILSLARAHGVPAGDVLVRDASRQSVLLNAHVSGFAGQARIVLDDNTLTATPMPEVEMVMAHEIGHYVLRHVLKGVAFQTLVMVAGFLLIARALARLVARFGRAWGADGPGDVGVLPAFWALFWLWIYVTLPVTNGFSRMQEAEADLFGLNASRQPLGLAEFMIRDADTGRLDPGPVEEWIFYDHPSPRQRIFTAMRWRAEHPGSGR